MVTQKSNRDDELMAVAANRFGNTCLIFYHNDNILQDERDPSQDKRMNVFITPISVFIFF